MNAAPDFKLHCRHCPAAFIEMVDLLRHVEREHEPRPPRKTRRVNELGSGDDEKATRQRARGAPGMRTNANAAACWEKAGTP